jgi:lipoprotein-anchoring transpeptidase ErfK/SrfK
MQQIVLSRFRAAALVMMALFGLAACVAPSGTVATSGPAAPPAGQVDDTVYAAMKDGSYTLPAVPTEKVPDQFKRQTVRYETDQPSGTIIVDPANKFLYLVTGKNTAIRYGVGVGRAGFEWSGEAVVAEKKMYATWYPPKEMIARKPELAKWANGQPGSPQNPLGARTLYLRTGGKDYGYRIHGSPEWWTIGTNASSGCIRMIHQDVIDLFNRVPVGTKVIVLTASGKMPSGLTLPKPHAETAAKPKAEPKAEVVVPVGAVPALKVLPVPSIAAGAAAARPAVVPASPAPAATTPPACKVALVGGKCPEGQSDG